MGKSKSGNYRRDNPQIPEYVSFQGDLFSRAKNGRRARQMLWAIGFVLGSLKVKIKLAFFVFVVLLHVVSGN